MSSKNLEDLSKELVLVASSLAKVSILKLAVDSDVVEARLKRFFATWIKDIESTYEIKNKSGLKLQQVVNDYVVKVLSPRVDPYYYEKSVSSADLYYESIKDQKDKWRSWEKAVVKALIDSIESSGVKKAQLIKSSEGFSPVLDINIMPGLRDELEARTPILDNINLTLWWQDDDDDMVEVPIDRVRVVYDDHIKRDSIVVDMIEFFPSGLSRLIRELGKDTDFVYEQVNIFLRKGDFEIGSLDRDKLNTWGIEFSINQRFL